MQTEKLNTKNIYSDLLNQGKTGKNVPSSAENSFSDMLKFSTDNTALLDTDMSFRTFDAVTSAATMFVHPENSIAARSSMSHTADGKTHCKSNGSKYDEKPTSVKSSSDAKVTDDKSSFDSDENSVSVTDNKNKESVNNENNGKTEKKTGKSDKKTEDTAIEDELNNIVFSPVTYETGITPEGEFTAEVMPFAIVKSEENFAAPDNADENGVQFNSDKEKITENVFSREEMKDTDFTSVIGIPEEKVSAEKFSHTFIKRNELNGDRNIFVAANDNNGDAAVENNNFMPDLLNNVRASVDKSQKQDNFGVALEMNSQEKNIATLIGANENLVVEVNKNNNGGKKGILSAVTEMSFPVICENSDGDTAIMGSFGETAVLNTKGVFGTENEEILSENKNNRESLSISGDIAIENSLNENNSFSTGLNSEPVSAGNNIQAVGAVGSASVGKSAITGKIKEAGELKPEVKIDDVAEQINIKVSKLKPGEDTVSVKLKPQELGEIQIKLNIGSNGKLNVEINSNKEETHVLLQKNVEVLQKMMTDNGYKSDVSGFAFNFRGSNNNGNGTADFRHNHQNNSGFMGDIENTEENIPTTLYPQRGILA